jgi:hypothetical protein
MEYTKEQIFKIGKEKFVTDLVNEILGKDTMDDNVITGVSLQDSGNCIHITFSGGVSASTIIAIGEAFGDDSPNVFGEGENTISIVFCNEKFDCLIGTTETNG